MDKDQTEQDAPAKVDKPATGTQPSGQGTSGPREGSDDKPVRYTDWASI